VFGLFRRSDPEQRRQAESVKVLVREILCLADEVTVTVSEIQCGDASCPGTETVILVLQKGVKTRAYKVLAPLMEVDRAAVEKALAGPG